MQAPAHDTFEVNVFAPGFGECVVAHLGNNRWIIVDSCRPRGLPSSAALEYLNSICVSPLDVALIVITHWHDDHIRGISNLVEACTNAKICISNAFGQTKFIEFVMAFSTSKKRLGVTSGSDEIRSVIELCRKGGRTLIGALGARRVLNLPEVAGSDDVEVWSLSPSDPQYRLFLLSLTKLMPVFAATKMRATDQGPNHLSVATWVRVGKHAVLLGADLEERQNDDLGWAAIIKDEAKPKLPALAFKVPHHGSLNGHNNDVWTQMLTAEPISFITRYDKNQGLPTSSDLARVRNLSRQTYLVGSISQKAWAKLQSKAVDKTAREVAKNLVQMNHVMGHARLRISLINDSSAVEVFGSVQQVR